MNIPELPSFLNAAINTGVAHAPGRDTLEIDNSPPAQEVIPGEVTGAEDKEISLGQKPTRAPGVNHELDFSKGVIYGSITVTPPNPDYTYQERAQRIDAYAGRVVTQINNIESGNEGESNIRYQKTAQFMQPSGYFSGGLLAAGYDPHEKFTVRFYTGKKFGNYESVPEFSERTYFAWEIAAGALIHDRLPTGGVIDITSTHIEQKDRRKINDLTSLGNTLQPHWEKDISKPMRDASGALAKRSGKADAYVIKGILHNLRNEKAVFEQLSPDAQAAISRTLDKNGNVVIPDVYGYPLAGYAFIPYINYHGNYDHRPNKGVMINLKNGSVSEIHGDDDFAKWAGKHRDELVNSFNAGDRQGKHDAHWQKADDVLDELIQSNADTVPGRKNQFSDRAVPVRETFNYALSRKEAYYLKFGDLKSGIAHHYQAMNAKNAVWADRTQVFGASQQRWKAAHDVWNNTFAYVPVVGNTGNIVFGIHDAINGMTEDDRVGGAAAAAISALQLAQELATAGVEDEIGELATLAEYQFKPYTWRGNPQTNEIEFVRLPKVQPERDIAPIENPLTPIDNPPASVPSAPEVPPPSQAGNISAHALLDGERRLENITPIQNKIYLTKDPVTGDDRWLIRYTDATGVRKVYEIRSDFKPSDGYVQIIDASRKPVLTVYATEREEWVAAGVKGGGRISRFFSKEHSEAREALKSVTKKYQDAINKVPPDEKEVNEYTAIVKQIQTAPNAGEFPKVVKYIDDDWDFVNKPLRQGESTPELEKFLAQFKQVNTFYGKAYRVAFVTPEGAEQLKNGLGKVFRDKGVQSASISVRGTAKWDGLADLEARERGDATQRVVYVFDESIPKKNMAITNFGDHVAIEPGKLMKVLAVKEKDGVLFVYMTAPTEMPEAIFNVYNGRAE